MRASPTHPTTPASTVRRTCQKGLKFPMTLPPPPPAGRKRGAPPGNHNNLKHGFYSRHVRAASSVEADQASQVALTEEIAMLRLFIRNVLEMGSQCGEQDLQQSMECLRTVCLAISTLNRLIRTQHWLTPQKDGLGQSIQEALEITYRDLGIS